MKNNRTGFHDKSSTISSFLTCCNSERQIKVQHRPVKIITTPRFGEYVCGWKNQAHFFAQVSKKYAQIAGCSFEFRPKLPQAASGAWYLLRCFISKKADHILRGKWISTPARKLVLVLNNEENLRIHILSIPLFPLSARSLPDACQ